MLPFLFCGIHVRSVVANDLSVVLVVAMLVMLVPAEGFTYLELACWRRELRRQCRTVESSETACLHGSTDGWLVG